VELVTLFRFLEVLVDAPAGAVLTFFTDLPGNAMSVRSAITIPATIGRHPYRLSLSGACKGKLYQVKIVPQTWNPVAIYAAKVYARVLGPAPTQWAWYTVPVMETSVEWQPVKLPIPQTSDEWQPVKLPIPQTSDDWQALKLPIPATSDEWTPAPLPVKPTPVVPDWVQVQIDG
jgi:hypothetical protein